VRALGSDRHRSCSLPVALTVLSFALCSAQGGTGSPLSGSADRPYQEVARSAGIRHDHAKPQLDPVLGNIMSWMASIGAAAAAGDYDNDGWVDLYVTNSRRGTPNFLYHNNGDGTFTEVAGEAGVAMVNNENGVSMDCIWADVDNDGWADLYIVRWGHDLLFHNNGDGTFTDQTRMRFRKRDGSPGTDWANGNGVVALDHDLDGRLDLYVGNYFREVDLWNLSDTHIMHDDFERSRNAGKNFFYHQQLDGTFTERAEVLGLQDTGWTLAVGSADVDNDGWPDLYCANDFGPDQIFLNQGDATFVNATDTTLGYDTKKGMNVDFGDFNNDGWTDIYVSNITTSRYLHEGNMLWRNNGPGTDGRVRFLDIALEAGAFDGGWGWGAKFLDYDNDGDLDILAVNGFISAGKGSYWYDLASWTVQGVDVTDSRNWPELGGRSFSGYERFRLWRNDGSEFFTEVAAEAGLDSDRDGRGVVYLDYDNDGDLDVFVANQGQKPQLFRNTGAPDTHWLLVRLQADPATGINADAVGARVTVVTDHGSQFRERDGGNGYAGQSDPRLHFGLGDTARIRLVEVRWPDGGLQYLEDVEMDAILTVHQDPASYVGAPRTTVAPPVPRLPSKEAPAKVVPQMPPEELDRMLVKMESGLRENPGSHALAHAYRQRCVDHQRHDRSIALFREFVLADPSDAWARLELSVAYVDKMPSRGGIAAVVSKGMLASKSLDHLDEILARDDGSWLAHYARGVNHLHWPRALRHSDDAVADFRRCLELQSSHDGPAGPDYYVRTYILLGDALAKMASYKEARSVWHEGRKQYPGSEELRERLAVHGDAALLQFVEERRSLENPIDTDFSFWKKAPVTTSP